MSTTIGDILDNFFSPFSKPKLWIMPEKDNYTKVVRKWQPVINAVNQAKINLQMNCATWSKSHMTSSSWRPGMTDPPATDPNAYNIWVDSPPGTDPSACKKAFIIYVTSKAARTIPGPFPILPEIQTSSLYTCSIGSFGLYTTVDSIDCTKKTAKMNFWMYNAMDRQSFGRFANDPVFSLSGMQRQYMWWNWSETVSWGPAPATGSSKPSSGKW